MKVKARPLPSSKPVKRFDGSIAGSGAIPMREPDGNTGPAASAAVVKDANRGKTSAKRHRIDVTRVSRRSSPQRRPQKRRRCDQVALTRSGFASRPLPRAGEALQRLPEDRRVAEASAGPQGVAGDDAG